MKLQLTDHEKFTYKMLERKRKVCSNAGERKDIRLEQDLLISNALSNAERHKMSSVERLFPGVSWKERDKNILRSKKKRAGVVMVCGR